MKKFIKSFFIIAFGFAIFALCLAQYLPNISANAATISYITTSVGENETSVGINYHCSINESYVQYSTSSNFTKETTSTVNATATLWSKEANAADTNTGFSERYISKVSITDLKENTQYFYRVYAGSSISSTYKFKTHSASATKANFLFGTDIHAAGGSYTPTRPNSMINNIRTNVRNLNLLVLTGDQVDRGGYKEHWDSYYKGMTVYNDLMVAAIPGNHEYYHTSGGEYVSPEFFNQFHNNPQNGPAEKLNSTYYFKYGNILFIMLDTIKKDYTTEQKTWFKTVVENNPAQWIIVGTHSNAITGGSYQSDSRWMMTNWAPLFEEYQVDLVIGGHEHVYIRKNNLYKNEVNEDLGVTYYVSPAAQHKLYSIQTEYKDKVDDWENVNYKLNTIQVTDQKLTVTLYDEQGSKVQSSTHKNVLTFDVLPKRNAKITTQKDTTLLNALNLSHDKENDDATITWNRTYYGNVKNVVVERTADDNTMEFSKYIASEKVTSLNIGPIYRDRNYHIKVTLHKLDGSTVTKEFDIENVIPYNLNLQLDGGEIQSPEEWVTYLSGKSTKLPTPIKNGYIFKGWYESNSFEGNAIEKISSTDSGDKTYYAKWLQQFKITYDTRGGFLNESAKTSYIEGDTYSFEPPYQDSDMFEGWYLTPDFSGEPIESITPETKGDLTLYAKWSSDNKKKCGKKNTAIIVNLLTAISLLTLAFKKKK